MRTSMTPDLIVDEENFCHFLSAVNGLIKAALSFGPYNRPRRYVNNVGVFRD